MSLSPHELRKHTHGPVPVTSHCCGLTPEEAAAHAEQLIHSLFLVGCVPAERMSTAARELGYGLVNIFGRAELPRRVARESAAGEGDKG